MLLARRNSHWLAALIAVWAFVWTPCRSGAWVYSPSTLMGAPGSKGGTAIVALSADGRTMGVSFSTEGLLRIFTWANDTWTQQGDSLIGTEAAAQAASLSLSADGNVLAVGGPVNNNFAGAAWVWARTDQGWAQQGGKLVGTDAAGPAGQGASVCLSADGRSLAVGGNSDGNYRGAAWVFALGAGGWEQQGGKLVGSGAVSIDGLDSSIAMSGDGSLLAVGDENFCGAWTFARTSGGYVQQGIELMCPGDGSTSLGPSFVGLSADANTLAVGAMDMLRAWIFTRANNSWALRAELQAPSTRCSHVFTSFALSPSGAVFAMGNPCILSGGTWVFAVQNGTWQPQGAQLDASTAKASAALPTGGKGIAQQGSSIALSASGSLLLVGATNDLTVSAAAVVFTGSAGAPCGSGVECASRTCFQARCLNASLPGQLCATGSECLSSLCVDQTCRCVAGCTAVLCGGCQSPATCTASGSCSSPAPPFQPPAFQPPASVEPAHPLGQPTMAGGGGLSTSGHTSVAVVAGSAAAGALLLALIAGVGFFIWRRRALRRDPSPSDNKDNALDGPASDSATLGQSLSQVDYCAGESDHHAQLLRQLHHAYRTKACLLNHFRLVSDGADQQRIGSRYVVQFACNVSHKDRQFAFKFVLDAGAFATEREHMHNKAVQVVMPPIHAVEGNQDGNISLLGKPLPPFIVTERGEPLHEWLRRKNAVADLNFSNAVNVVVHMVQRVAQIHAAGLVHGNIKPSSIIWLPSRNEWSIVGFRTAAAIGSTIALSINLSYAAPETVLAWADQQPTVVADPAVDVWAVGLIAFELLTNTPKSSHNRDMVVQTMRGKLQLPWEVASFDTEGLGFMRDGVMRMVARDSKARPSLHEVQQEWSAFFQR